ncbi:transporter, putative [Plasmodium knowlesi strain H]|uniref:Transporter, putative n=3 Tax=Plasmodium knowlesi TaxID=5850 RepID=A0A1A7VGQ9_PLAKH|nr:transporter, putative [Plasmodium knowlesi strain H]OTN64268.1 putative Transporter [Plasmodium knowlesi]CAA9990976.1 transporter, putative [Plasmodium knowlesi strain H]SBO20777.1 transporter, putative [Plasmodium knowlesi strain H]SBO21223.1 transporter, putative [Plasmodium knowlesi strain H]VVS80450.1 transporter, putative [Plasmodium knowlesi strain H]
MKALNPYSKKEEEVQNHDDMNTQNSTVNGININDININDIEENISDHENERKVKKKGKAIEYHLFDVEAYNTTNNSTIESFVDLSSIRSSYLSENKKKKAKKKRISYLKKQLKIYKKKYKILPEHTIDQDTSYEESVKNENKDYRVYDLREVKTDKGTNDFLPQIRKDTIGVKKDVFVNVIKFIILISSIFSFGTLSTAITKYIIFVKKFTYTQIITLLEFFIMYLILKLVTFCGKMKSSTNLTRKEYIKYIISISALLGLSVVTGNSAYSYLEIPVISVIKSSSLILIYFLSIKFGLKEFKCSLFCSILTILMGVIMSVITLKIDSLFGIFLLVISVIASSLKWVFTNVLLRSTSMKPHIILLHIYQMAMLIIFIPTLLIDLTCVIKDYSNNVLTVDQIFSALILVSIGALSSIFLILAEFSLISYTSSVTLSIVFIGREAILLIIGSLFFGENIDFSSSIGIAISMIGTILYGYASK